MRKLVVKWVDAFLSRSLSNLVLDGAQGLLQLTQSGLGLLQVRGKIVSHVIFRHLLVVQRLERPFQVHRGFRQACEVGIDQAMQRHDSSQIRYSVVVSVLDDLSGASLRLVGRLVLLIYIQVSLRLRGVSSAMD